MKQKQLYVVGSLSGLLFLFWWWGPHHEAETEFKRQSATAAFPYAIKNSIETSKRPESYPAISTKPQDSQAAKSTQVPATEESSQGVWSKSESQTYWDQIPTHKKAIDFFTNISAMKFAPLEKPVYVGMNEQGFDQYEFKTAQGANVVQWKRSNEVVIEEAVMQNGDKLTRRGPEPGNPTSSMSYEYNADKSMQQTTYHANGSVESLRFDQNGRTTIYYYDDQGRLRETYFGPIPK